jgi:hypothetical protein
MPWKNVLKIPTCCWSAPIICYDNAMRPSFSTSQQQGDGQLQLSATRRPWLEECPTAPCNNMMVISSNHYQQGQETMSSTLWHHGYDQLHLFFRISASDLCPDYQLPRLSVCSNTSIAYIDFWVGTWWDSMIWMTRIHIASAIQSQVVCLPYSWGWYTVFLWICCTIPFFQACI